MCTDTYEKGDENPPLCTETQKDERQKKETLTIAGVRRRSTNKGE